MTHAEIGIQVTPVETAIQSPTGGPPCASFTAQFASGKIKPKQLELSADAVQTIADLLRSDRFQIKHEAPGVRIMHLHESFDFDDTVYASHKSRFQMQELFKQQIILSPKVCTYLLNLFSVSSCETDDPDEGWESAYVSWSVFEALSDLYDPLADADLDQTDLHLVPVSPEQVAQPALGSEG